jgi:hypothetical protein
MLRVAIAIFAVSVAATGCSELGGGTGQVSKKIGAITQDPAVRELDLGKLTGFGWEYFYFFKPGTTREEICSFIGAKKGSCERIFRYERVPETHVALLFGLNGNLTHTELHDRAFGEFEIEMKEGGYPRSESVFLIRRSLGGEAVSKVYLERK